MLIRFLKNIWEKIRDEKREGTIMGVLVGIGIFMIVLGAIIIEYNLELLIGHFLFWFGLIIFCIPFLIIFFVMLSVFFRWLKEIWICTREEIKEEKKENEKK